MRLDMWVNNLGQSVYWCRATIYYGPVLLTPIGDGWMVQKFPDGDPEVWLSEDEMDAFTLMDLHDLRAMCWPEVGYPALRQEAPDA